MNFLKDFVIKMLMMQVVGMVGLLIAGWVLTITQQDIYGAEQTFFSYRINHLDLSPAWFVFVLTQLCLNGFWLFKLAVLQGSVNTPTRGPFGNWDVQVPINYLRIFAVNLVIVPGSLFTFMLIRHCGW